jgi:hypothetical protein
MPGMRAQLVALGLLPGLLVACSNGPAPARLAGPAASFSKSANASPNAPAHSVTGGGKVDFSILGPPSGVETYGFEASIDGNGNVKGQFQATFTVPSVKFHADITCLAVDGNDAWMGAVVTQTHDPVAFPVGTEGVIRARDNGQGANAADDELGYWVLTSASSCTAMRTDGVYGALFPWIHGNVQVR